MALTGVRKYLTDNGIADTDIGYNNGVVTVKGKNFINANVQAADDPTKGLMKDSTYADLNDLSNAYKNYTSSNRTSQINATTDTIGQKVNAAPFEFKQTQAPFQYNNPEADPLYQAAMRQAQSGAQTATNNAMVGLGSRGIGNSSVAVDRANQIQQKAIGTVNDTVLPQLMAQAYGRYQDQNNNDYRNQMANYGAGQDQIKNLTGYAGTLNGLNQQDADNTYRNNVFGEQQKQNNVDLAKWGTSTYGYGAPKSDAGVFFDQYQGAKTLPVQQFEYGQGQDALQNGRADRQLNASLSNMSSDNARAASAEARAAGNNKLAQLFDIWDRTGKAPAGIPGVAEGTPIAGKTAAEKAPTSSDYKMDPNFGEDVTYFKANPNEKSLLDTNAGEFIKEYGYDGYVALRKAAGMDTKEE